MIAGHQVEFSIERPLDVEVVTIELPQAQFEEFTAPQSITGVFQSFANEQEIDKAFALGSELASALGMSETAEEKLERLLSPQQLEVIRINLEQGKTIEIKAITEK